MNSRIVLISLVLLLFFAAGCTQTNIQEKTTVTVKISVFGETGELVVSKSLEAETGSNAFDLMKENFEMDFEEFSFGVLVNSVEGIVPPEGYYLGLYVNGKYADKGITDYSVEEGLEIEWRVKEALDFPLE